MHNIRLLTGLCLALLINITAAAGPPGRLHFHSSPSGEREPCTRPRCPGQRIHYPPPPYHLPRTQEGPPSAIRHPVPQMHQDASLPVIMGFPVLDLNQHPGQSVYPAHAHAQTQSYVMGQPASMVAENPGLRTVVEGIPYQHPSTAERQSVATLTHHTQGVESPGQASSSATPAYDSRITEARQRSSEEYGQPRNPSPSFLKQLKSKLKMKKPQ